MDRTRHTPKILLRAIPPLTEHTASTAEVNNQVQIRGKSATGGLSYTGSPELVQRSIPPHIAKVKTEACFFRLPREGVLKIRLVRLKSRNGCGQHSSSQPRLARTILAASMHHKQLRSDCSLYIPANYRNHCIAKRQSGALPSRNKHCGGAATKEATGLNYLNTITS